MGLFSGRRSSTADAPVAEPSRRKSVLGGRSSGTSGVAHSPSGEVSGDAIVGARNQLQRAHAAEKEAQRAVEAANKALANAKDEVERAHAHVDAVEREAKADAKAAQAKSKAASGMRAEVRKMAH